MLAGFALAPPASLVPLADRLQRLRRSQVACNFK
jgi:hypothetical protein